MQSVRFPLRMGNWTVRTPVPLLGTGNRTQPANPGNSRFGRSVLHTSRMEQLVYRRPKSATICCWICLINFLTRLIRRCEIRSKTGKQFKSKPATLIYTQCFVDSLIAEVEKDEMIVEIHAAVGGGTGLDLLQKGFPDRCFDVGIAGQHTVTFAAGLAAEGLKPFCAICSSFLQRGFDQVNDITQLMKAKRYVDPIWFKSSRVANYFELGQSRASINFKLLGCTAAIALSNVSSGY